MGIIGSFFTNPERSFANWAMDLSLNNDINVDLRFSSADPSEAKKAYLNIPAEPEYFPDLTLEERKKIARLRLAYFQEQIPAVTRESIQQAVSKLEEDKKSAPLSEKESERLSQKSKDIPPVSAKVIVQSGELVTYVEKFDTPDLVRYGKFCEYSNFSESPLLTSYFLVEGWLVVSNSKDFIEMRPFKFKNGDELEVDPYTEQCEKYEVLKQQIQSTIKAWFKFERKKIGTLLATSFASGLLFAAMVSAVRRSTDSIDKIQAQVFLTLCLFLQYVSINSGITLYKLYGLEFSVLHIDNVGLWVHQMRTLAAKHRDIVRKYPSVAKFFTPEEQEVLYKRILYKA